MINSYCLPFRQGSDRFWQFGSSWHDCTIRKHWNDSDASLKRSCDLQSDEVGRVVKPTSPKLVDGCEPAGANERN